MTDLYQYRDFDALPVVCNGDRREASAINLQVVARICTYLGFAAHGAEHDEALFRPLRGNAKPLTAVGSMDPDAIDRIVRKYAACIGLAHGYSASLVWATFITTALEMVRS